MFNLPFQFSRCRAQIYTSPSWTRWVPQPSAMTFLVVLGAGGGGGGGRSGASLTARAGGGGGSTGALARLYIPTAELPGELWLLPGTGGIGSTGSGVGGGDGTLSYVSIAQTITAADLILVSGPSSSNGGGPAGAGAAGLPGTRAPVATILDCPFVANGYFKAIQGQLGGNGGASTAAGELVTAQTTLTATGGAGGGGASSADVDHAGGAIVAEGLFPTIAGGVIAGGNGGAGYVMRPPQYGLGMTGGSGGGSNALGTAGTGGSAAGCWGCGGAGGGAGVTGGGGGLGGHGLIIVVSYW